MDIEFCVEVKFYVEVEFWVEVEFSGEVKFCVKVEFCLDIEFVWRPTISLKHFGQATFKFCSHGADTCLPKFTFCFKIRI